MKIHELKVDVEFIDDMQSDQKKFEIRKNDRDFKVGDILCLRGWSSEESHYTGWETWRKVTHILMGGRYGVQEGYAILGIEKCEPPAPPSVDSQDADFIRKHIYALAYSGMQHELLPATIAEGAIRDALKYEREEVNRMWNTLQNHAQFLRALAVRIGRNIG